MQKPNTWISIHKIPSKIGYEYEPTQHKNGMHVNNCKCEDGLLCHWLARRHSASRKKIKLGLFRRQNEECCQVSQVVRRPSRERLRVSAQGFESLTWRLLVESHFLQPLGVHMAIRVCLNIGLFFASNHTEEPILH